MSETPVAIGVDLADPSSERTVFHLADITIPSLQALLDKVAPDVKELASTAVDCDAMAEYLLEAIGRVSTVRDELDEQRLNTTLPLRDVVGKINGGFNPAIDSLNAAIKTAKDALTAWNAKVRREREEADRKARADAKRIAEEAEAKRKEAEAEAQKRIDEAAAAAAAGDNAKADQLLAQAQVTVDAARETEAHAVTTALAPPRLAGGAGRVVKGTTVTWKGRLKPNPPGGVPAFAALVIAAGHAASQGDYSLLALLELNQKNLDLRARVDREHMNIPGVESYSDEGITARKRPV